ncbi:MAG: hypothetical protein Q7U04_11035 [Bacteriovorax sp.]|nr:hypothetical protein [Bacteriovorax sp.]
MKLFGLFFLFLFARHLCAKDNSNKSTVFSMCTRKLENKTQTIFVATETLSASKCKILGKNKAEQYTSVGWKCIGYRGEDFFSCENKKASDYASRNGVKLDNLTFTNLQKHRSLLAYLRANSNKLCHEDRDELMAAGVTDAVCHKP